MENFEFLRHITLGQYIYRESPVHQMDPRAKIAVATLLIVAITFNPTYTANLILFGVTLLIVMASRIPLRYVFSGVKPALPVIGLLVMLQLAFYGEHYKPSYGVSVTYLQWGWIHITNGSLQLVIVSLLRFLELLFVTALLTNTTTMTDLTVAIEDLLKPLEKAVQHLTPRLFFAHQLALVGMIALRFVPLLAEQLEIIMKAQAARGAKIGSSGRWHILNTARETATLIVPLFLDGLRRAEDLILAMEARCYGMAGPRTRLRQFKTTRMDWSIVVLALLFSVVMVAGRKWFVY